MMKLRYGPEDSSTSLEVGWAVSICIFNLNLILNSSKFKLGYAQNSIELTNLRCFLPYTMTPSPDFIHFGV